MEEWEITNYTSPLFTLNVFSPHLEHSEPFSGKEFLVTTDPSDASMFLATSRLRSMYPHLSSPLVSSSRHSSVARLLSSSKAKSGKLRMIWGSGDFERLLPSHLVMIPKERSEREATLEMEQLCKHQGLNCDF